MLQALPHCTRYLAIDDADGDGDNVYDEGFFEDCEHSRHHDVHGLTKVDPPVSQYTPVSAYAYIIHIQSSSQVMAIWSLCFQGSV